MTSRTSILIITMALAIAAPSIALAQLSIPGKVMTYRTVDTDSGEELQRMRTWEVKDGGATVEMSAATYPVGTQVLSECTFANGLARPAVSYRSVMRAANGEIERTDFDTFDTAYYPFLAQPVSAEMQPGTCLNKNQIDLPSLARGNQTMMWMWSDSGLIGAIFNADGIEKLTVPAGTFDALRIRVDTDLSKLFPRVPALFLKLIKPHFTIWITRTEPYELLKIVGFGSNGGPQHKNTAIELASIGELSANDSYTPAELAQAEAVGDAPQLTAVNSGSFAQGDRAGHVTLATASTAQGELLVTHVAFNNGLATESRTLLDRRASPTTVYLDDRSFATDGAMVRKHVLFFRKAAFPDDPKKDLPADLYGADTTLGLVLPRVLPDDADEAIFHVMDFSGQVNQLSVRKEGLTTVALTRDDARAIHAQLKPIVDIPILLKPLAYFFIPSFDAYFAADPTHRVLKFEGPLGPPGVPNATMIADEKVLPEAPASPALSTRR
jgi:hypothetical protein